MLPCLDEVAKKPAKGCAESRCAQIETTRSYAVSSFSLALLEVGDSLGLALKSMETQLERLRREDPEGAVVQELEKFAAGVRMTENLFLQTLEKFGIVRFPSVRPCETPVAFAA